MEQVMSSAFEFGLLLHTRSMLGDKDRPPSFDELWGDAAYAEQMNFDQIWLGDSVCILNRARGDCLTTMAALACKTDRIKIGTAPLIAALRNPVLLAHSLATLDVISQGRLSVAVSVAGRSEYNEREFIACGVPFRALRAVPVPMAVVPPATPAAVPTIVAIPPAVVAVVLVATIPAVVIAAVAEIAAQFSLVSS
jgi:hypothetical protein